MTTAEEQLIASDIEAYLAEHQAKGMLRFLTCGSVDDGKSTLIGRLLYDSKMVFEDHLAALETDSKKFGTQADAMDLALLVDGLAAEREQGITIDVAYRFFSTRKRKFIVADTPGHEQYTRNMATGASTADLGGDPRSMRGKGVLTQTRRHSYIVALLGIRHVDRGGQQDGPGRLGPGARSRRSPTDYRAFAGRSLGLSDMTTWCHGLGARPARTSSPARARTWPGTTGPTLMQLLETVEIDDTPRAQPAPFRMPVQWVNRPNLGVSAAFQRPASSSALDAARGSEVRVASAVGQGASRVTRIVGPRRAIMDQAQAGQSVTLTASSRRDRHLPRLDDQLAAAGALPQVTDQFAGRYRLDGRTEPMLPERRPYLAKLRTNSDRDGTRSPRSSTHAVDVNTLEKHGRQAARA